MEPVRRIKIRNDEIKGVVECFVKNISASKAEQKLDINRKTVSRYYNFIRLKIAEQRQSYIKKHFHKYDVDEIFTNTEAINKTDKKIVSAKKKIVYIIIHNGTLISTITPNNNPPYIQRKTHRTDYRQAPRKWKPYPEPLKRKEKRSKFINTDRVEFSIPKIRGYSFCYLDLSKSLINKKANKEYLKEFGHCFKLQISKYNGVSPQQWHYYLCEIEFRMKNKLRENLTPQLLQLCFPNIL